MEVLVEKIELLKMGYDTWVEYGVENFLIINKLLVLRMHGEKTKHQLIFLKIPINPITFFKNEIKSQLLVK